MKLQLTKEQLIKIAKTGFPDRVKQFIDFDNVEMIEYGSVYRLYDKNVDFYLMLPKEEHLSVFIGEDNFIQIQVGSKAFNHYSAIKEIEKMLKK